VAAAEHHHASEVACLAVTQANPGDVETTADLATARMGVGQALAAMGKKDEALDACRSGVKTFEQLASEHADDDMVWRNTSASVQMLGIVQGKFGDPRAAMTSHARALEIDRRRVAADPANAQAKRFVAVDLAWLAEVTAAAAELPDVAGDERISGLHAARDLYVESLKLLSELRDTKTLTAQFAPIITEVTGCIATLDEKLSPATSRPSAPTTATTAPLR
jgi:hypothetical protein